MLKLSQFTYDLPEKLIAKQPVVPRDHSRLLRLDRLSGKISHHHFYDLPDLLQPGDILVRNNTKVIPARLIGKKTSGGRVEILMSKLVVVAADGEVWECLTHPGLKPGQEVVFTGSDLAAVCVAASGYTRQIRFNKSGSALLAALEKSGLTPLPPYIDPSEETSGQLAEQYQTIFAKSPGSAAAPTAGLHFTPELDHRLTETGIQIAELTLHVGLGTFLPVKEEEIANHQMHTEKFTLPETTAQFLNQAKAAGRRIIAVGTTTTRVLEACSTDAGLLEPRTGETDIFIYPGYRFRFVDGLITNFHLPESTLLMLVAAFVSAPNTKQKFTHFLESSVGKAYTEAIKNEYRFYSFGDGMLITDPTPPPLHI